MFACIICRCVTEADDALFTTPHGKCVCLRCYQRETGSEMPMPKALRKDVTQAAGTE